MLNCRTHTNIFMISVKNTAKLIKRRLYFEPKSPDKELPKIFNCHIPKCAGTAISAEMLNRLYKGYNVGSFRIVPEATLNSANMFSINMMRAREIILSYNLSDPHNYFGTGHVACRPLFVKSFNNDWNFITILRNPINRWVSEYVYNTFKKDNWYKNTLPIDEYIKSESGKITGISFLRYFSTMPENYTEGFNEFIEEAINNLNQFSIVGIFEDLDSFSSMFSEQFNKKLYIKKKNESPNNQASDDIKSNKVIMKQIEQLCEPDIRIYNHFLNK